MKPPSRHPSLAVAALLVAVLSTVLVGCGGGGDDDEARELAEDIVAQAARAAEDAEEAAEEAEENARDDDSPSSARATEEDVEVPDPVTRTIGKKGWHDGFAVTVVDATAEIEAGLFNPVVSVEVNLTYQNLGNEPADPLDADLEVDGESVDGFWDTPGVPGGGTAKGSVVLSIRPPDFDSRTDEVEDIDLDDALDLVTLVYGDAADNQTRIPLATSGRATSIEPKDLGATGTLTQGQLVVEVKEASFTPSYESGEKGKGLLDVRVKLTCTPDCQAQGHGVDRSDFSLTAPDGTSVIPDSRSGYCCDAIYPGTVSDDERNVVSFVVALPGTGKYTLTFANKALTGQGIAAPTFDLTV